METPASLMYSDLRGFSGLTSRSLAELIVSPHAQIGSRPVLPRLGEKTFLSRHVVHASKDELPDHGNLPAAALAITARIAKRYGEGSARKVVDRYRGVAACAMERALADVGADANVYSNAVARIEQTRGLADDARASLLVLLFIAAGTTWDAGEAARITFEFMEGALGAPDTTPEPKLLGTGRAVKERASAKGLALLRVEGGCAKPPLHVLSSEEAGTVIGFMPGPDDPCAITDVDRDVSRRHARIRLVDGRWLLEDLGSTNGTRILPGVASGDGKKRSFIQVEPGRPVEITNADQIVLGATTRFLAIRVVE